MNTSLHPQLLQLQQDFSVCPVQEIHEPWLSAKRLQLLIKRDDLLHPIISGNKWRKLKYSVNQALQLGASRLVSMGGIYSNHLHALAYTGKCLNLKSKAFIRGECPETLTPTLHDLISWQMDLEFVSRSDYRQLRHYQSGQSLPGLLAEDYWLPEGGSNVLALQGVAESIAEINVDYDVIICACGTGATLAGIIASVSERVKVLGISALKGDFLNQDVHALLAKQNLQRDNWQILQNYHFGGFACQTPVLEAFIKSFSQTHLIPLEPVYTAKVMYAVYDLIKLDYFKPGQRIMVMHTGGLQGNRNLFFNQH